MEQDLLESIVTFLKINWKKDVKKKVTIDGVNYDLYADIRYYRPWFFTKEKHTVVIELKEK